MPTRAGDVVVSCTDSEPARCTLWHVVADAQQVPEPAARVSVALGTDAALKLAKMMARESRAAVFLFDQDALTWTQPLQRVNGAPQSDPMPDDAEADALLRRDLAALGLGEFFDFVKSSRQRRAILRRIDADILHARNEAAEAADTSDGE